MDSAVRLRASIAETPGLGDLPAVTLILGCLFFVLRQLRDNRGRLLCAVL